MAVITTVLKLTSAGDLQVMTSAEIAAIREQAIWAWSQSPNLSFSIVDSDGNLNAMTERYYNPGNLATSVSAFPANPPNVEAVDTTWDKLNFIRSGASDTWRTGTAALVEWPLYLNDDDEIAVMSKEDFYDTFITPTINEWHSATGSGNFAGGGLWAVYDTDDMGTGWTLVGGPIFTDYYSDATAMTTGNIPEADDQWDTDITSYYLHKKDAVAVSYEFPLYCSDSDNNIDQYTLNDFNNMLAYHMKNAIANRTGSILDYQIYSDLDLPATGVTMGQIMVDNTLDGTTDRNRFVNINAYYSQEVPSGVPETRRSYYLRLEKS